MSWLPNRHYLRWFLLLAVLRLQAQTAPPMDTLRGQLGIYIEDRFEQHFTATHYDLQTSIGHIELVFPSSEDVQGLTPGSDIEVTGHRQGRQFIVADDAAAAANATTPSLGLKVLSRAALIPREAAIGQRKTAVILINYLNQTSQPISKDQATSLLTTVNNFYAEASYQQYSILGDVYGYFSLPLNEFCSNGSENSASDFIAITNAGLQAVTNSGIDLSPYQSVMFLGPTATQCGGGYGTIGGAPGIVLIRSNTFSMERLLYCRMK